jgi:60S ribosomal protein uL30
VVCGARGGDGAFNVLPLPVPATPTPPMRWRRQKKFTDQNLNFDRESRADPVIIVAVFFEVTSLLHSSCIMTVSKVKISKEHKDLPLVPESVLKRRHDLDDLKRKKQANEPKQPVKRKGSYVKKPETYLAEAKNRRNEEARYRRVKKKGMMKRASNRPIEKTKEIPLDDDQVDVITYQANSVGAPMVFAIRIREDAGKVPKLVYDIMTQLSLKETNTGVFLRYDAVTRRHLHLLEPWVVYGKPSEGIVKDLMERKSFGNVNGEKLPLSDNTILERELGDKHGIICMEDMVHELTTVGENFDVVTKFLWPFPLTATRSRFEKEKLSLKQGKDYGDKGEEIDEYIKQML